MATSQNGWFAAPSLPLRPLVINGTAFVPGILDDDDVAYVLGYVLQQVNDRVERAVGPGCWGFSFRANVNDPNGPLSNHSSGTAVDFNAPAHPNGVPTSSTFTPEQIGDIHLILVEAQGAVRWGGDFNGTPDAMHFEINTDADTLARVARDLRNELEDPMPLWSEWPKAEKDEFLADVSEASAKAVWFWDGFNNAKDKAKALLLLAAGKSK